MAWDKQFSKNLIWNIVPDSSTSLFVISDCDNDLVPCSHVPLVQIIAYCATCLGLVGCFVFMFVLTKRSKYENQRLAWRLHIFASLYYFGIFTCAHTSTSFTLLNFGLIFLVYTISTTESADLKERVAESIISSLLSTLLVALFLYKRGDTEIFIWIFLLLVAVCVEFVLLIFDIPYATGISFLIPFILCFFVIKSKIVVLWYVWPDGS